MVSSRSSSLSSTSITSQSAPSALSVTSNEPVPVPPTTPTGELSTPLDLDHLDTNIMTGAASLALPTGFPTIVPPNTIAATSVGGHDLPDLTVTPTGTRTKFHNKSDEPEDYVPEVNNWSEEVQARFAHSLRGMAQLAVDVHKLDTSKTVAEHYCQLVSNVLQAGPIPFTPPAGTLKPAPIATDDMKYYISDVEHSTSQGWDIADLSLTQTNSNESGETTLADAGDVWTQEGISPTIAYIYHQWHNSGWSASLSELGDTDGIDPPLR